MMRLLFTAWLLTHCLAMTASADEVALPANSSATATSTTAVEPAADATADDDDKLPFKLSLPTESDRNQWQQAGFRLEVGYAYGRLAGYGGAPTGTHTHAATVRVGTRLDADWSLLGTFMYAAANTGVSGLRFMGTLDPTFHWGDHLQLAAGLGFGGIVEGRTGRPDPDATQKDGLASSFTFQGAYPPMSSCSGVGVAGLVRAAWMWVIGPLASTGATLQIDGQWTACVENVGKVEVDTGRPITRRQWWPNAGASLGWVIGWR